MQAIAAASSPSAVQGAVLILCADDRVAEALVRELATGRFQPLVGRPELSGRAALEWARPVVAVVDARHPAARSDDFLVAADHLEVGLVVFGDPALSYTTPTRLRTSVRTSDTRRIAGAVHDAAQRGSR